MKPTDSINHYCSAVGKSLDEFSGTKPVTGQRDLDRFTVAFVEAFLMDVNENEKEHDREEKAADREVDFKLSDIDAKAIRKIIKDCKQFQGEHDDAIRNGGTKFDDPYTQAGYDFYFTRCGHGVGFWETNDWPEPYSKELTAAAKKFGNVDGYVGDDNKVYVMGAEGDWSAGGTIKGVSTAKPEEDEPYKDSDNFYSFGSEDDDEDIRGIREGGSKLKPGEEHAGLTTDMTGRWTIGAFDTKKANKDETPAIKENLIPEPKPVSSVDKKNKFAVVCAWCDRDRKITNNYHAKGYTVSHGMCEHCMELMKRSARTEGVIKLKSIVESLTPEHSPLISVDEKNKVERKKVVGGMTILKW